MVATTLAKDDETICSVKVGTPSASARSSLSRMAWSVRPSGEATKRAMTRKSAAHTASTK